MENSATPFTAVYVRWLDSHGAMLLGDVPAAPTRRRAANDPQMVVHLVWDDEGDGIQP